MTRFPQARATSAAILAGCIVWPLAAAPGVAHADRVDTPATEQPAVRAWLRRNADPVTTADPAAGLADLQGLRRSAAGATVVGLGESVHGAAQLTTLKHRALRVLVEQLGFRSIAWEEDWTTGVRVDAYLRTGRGDLDAVVSRMSGQWQSAEVQSVLRWLRRWNTQHRDKVRFVGVDYYYTSLLAYDAVERYVARVAPGRLPEARRHLRVIRPFTTDMQAYFDWYVAQEDKARYVRHARRLFTLVEQITHHGQRRRHRLVVHHARQIVSYYENFRLVGNANFDYREVHAARNLKWWSHVTGDKVAYWAASAHTVAAPHLRAVTPPYPDIAFASTGSHLRRWFGADYVSVGFSVDRGRVRTSSQSTTRLEPAKPAWFEAAFADVGTDQFFLDLHARAPRPVRAWLTSPIRTRGFGGTGSSLTGGTAAQWYDAVVHRQRVSPARVP